MIRAGDRGYALLAALAALALFACIAFVSLAAVRGTIAEVGGLVEQARLAAAADGGLALAVGGLSIKNRTRRWPIDGRGRAVAFDGMRLTILVEDERGKVPLDSIDEAQAKLMFAAGGAPDDRARRLAAAFIAQRDGGGAPAGAGRFRTIEELRGLPGMDDALYARLAGAITVGTGARGAFSDRTAQPLALAVMSAGGGGAPADIERRRELAGQRTALDIADDVSLVGHPLTVRVRVDDGSAGRLVRATVIEFVTPSAWRIRYRL